MPGARGADVPRGALLMVLVVGVGCTLGPPPVELLPVRGPLPRVIAVWPIVEAPFDASRDGLLGGLEAALRARGHTVVPAAVAQELLDATAAPSPQVAPAELRQRLGADATLQFVITGFTAEGARPLREAQWDLTWRLVSLHDGGVQWSCTQRGHYVPPRDVGDPHRALDAEPDVLPIGGDPRLVYRDGRELLAALHRLAMAQLPARSR